ncbi:hypothetical protein N7497_000670 [Penicillium chrysogenum]|nr:hypothetical protein N7497_000670 [Penicillium chrysogenum]
MNSNALGTGRHRRQISTPVAPYQPAPVMTNMQPRRSHRRGQTVDYSSFSQQPTMDRHMPKTVSQLRDYFNEKSGFPSQQRDVQQYHSYAQQPERSFIPSSMHIQQPYQYQPHQSLGSDCQAFNQEQLQAIHTTTGSPAPSSVGAPALSRSASESSENTPLKLALHRMQQEQFSTQQQQQQQFIGNADWELFPQRNMPMGQNEQVTAYAGSMHPVSVQPKAPSAKILSQMSTASTAEMQRAQSLQGIPYVNSAQIKQQMPSPVNSPISASFTEVADMPSPSSYGMTPQNSNISITSSTGGTKTRAPSSVSSPIDVPAHDDLDARVKASVQQTGISTDEIAKFISGPDPKDGKWVCLYSGCLCRFGRKENIKSHVQTHLGDRQFKCDICEKHFVRGHDLKRHLKTHSGNKPFACACGASFARQDALTRHRQRDMCIGGFTGVVPKTTKRGRPPKKKNSRPDIETRQAKSTRTRQRVAEKSASTASVKPQPTLQDAPVFNSPNYAPSAAVSSYTPPTSPGNRYHTISSPCQTYNSLDAQLEDDMLPLSPPQLAHARYEQAMAQYGSNFGSQPYSQESTYSQESLYKSSVGSEIDIFMTQDPSDDLREEFGHLAHSGLPGFPTYQFIDSTDFAPVSSYYPEKTFSGIPQLDDDLTDPIDCLSSEFLVDP